MGINETLKAISDPVGRARKAYTHLGICFFVIFGRIRTLSIEKRCGIFPHRFLIIFTFTAYYAFFSEESLKLTSAVLTYT